MSQLNQDPHCRLNLLTREWVLVSPHRTERPWQGQVERVSAPALASYDPTCYLCPGNPRAGGAHNPVYESTFAFDNDFAALKPDTPKFEMDGGGLLVARGEPGVCRVVCFSPDHSLTVARMAPPALRKVVDTWVEQYRDLAAMPDIGHVQIFENRGDMMGASNPHPHCQIWSSASVPNEAAKEAAAQADYARAHGGCLLCDYLALEHREGARIVAENEAFAVLVPFWAVWPFETLLISKRHFSAMDELSGAERDLPLAAAARSHHRAVGALVALLRAARELQPERFRQHDRHGRHRVPDGSAGLHGLLERLQFLAFLV